MKLIWSLAISDEPWAFCAILDFLRLVLLGNPISSLLFGQGSRIFFWIVKEHSVWLVGDLINIYFWLDNWLDEPTTITLNILELTRNSFQPMVKGLNRNKCWVLPQEFTLSFPS